MAQDNRYNVFPSRMVLQGMKSRNIGAKRGYELLKKKSDAIKKQLTDILKDILETKRRMAGAMRTAMFSHTDAVWAGGNNLNSIVIENVKTASFRVKTDERNIAGVKLPVFTQQPVDHAQETIHGLSQGGQQVIKCREAFTAALIDLIKLASLQTSLKTLDEALKVTNRRVNALDCVVIPKITNTINYINRELEELDREDFFRLKKVRDMIQERRDEAAAEENAQLGITGEEEDANNLLSEFNAGKDMVVDSMFE